MNIYAAGDMKSGWAKRLQSLMPAIYHVLDPNDAPQSEGPRAYTDWDLAAIRRSDFVVCYMGPHNPSGFGMSLEAGYAHALGKPIVFIDCLGTDWRSKYFDMLRQVANAVVPTIEDAAKFISGDR
jgi:nucleoside 2-deoxyribosyltransferase